MCGIAGAWTRDADRGRAAVEAMCEQIAARGPDDYGLEAVAHGSGAVALGNRRLAIIDPSPAGHQPMWDAARRTAITFNGMIYNFRELRERLRAEGESFESDCDTEVVLRAYGRYGADCVRRLEGMFAFAIWDERRGELFLARDPLGIKPLYYRHDGDELIFASQVKALLASGLVPTRLDAAGIRTFLAYGAVSEPLTAIEGVSALPAGHTARFRAGRLELDRYWEPPAAADARPPRSEAVAELRRLLDASVRRHLMSDAPLGVFLSGGLDSSLVAALAARHAPDLRTLSVAFEDRELSEERYMRLVAEHVGSHHVEVLLRPEELLESLDHAFEAMDQPTFDGLNTYVVSRAAAQSGLKVAVSGLGADELFDGYGHTRRVSALEEAHRLPEAARRLAGRAAAALPSGSREKLAGWLAGGWPEGSSYELLRTLFSPGEVDGIATADGMRRLPRPGRVRRDEDVQHRLSVLDLGNYMKNVLLRDTDAMSMCHSLEVRVPYLDQPLVEWALRLSGDVKGPRKALLVAAAGDLVPREILSRRKQGFALPLARWMRGELREDVDAALRSPPELLVDIVEPAVIRTVWDGYLGDGRRWLRPWALFALSRWAHTLATPSTPRAGEPVVP